MIQILLADDDAFFRSSFSAMAPWAEYGCRPPLMAEDGRQAIALLGRHPVDLLITDMVMPTLGGVELIRYVRREYPDVTCFALSSFDDFAFVRQSLKEGASDYLLKHSLTTQVIAEMIGTLARGADLGETGARTRQNEAVFHQMVFACARGEAQTGPERLEDVVGLLGIAFPPPPVLVLAVKFEDVPRLIRRYEVKERFEQFLATAVNIAQSALAQHGQALCFSDGRDTIYAALSSQGFSSALFGAQTAHTLKRSLADILDRYLNVTVRVAAGEVCLNWQRVIPGFGEAERALFKTADGDSLPETETDRIVSISLSTEKALCEIMNRENFADVEALIRREFDDCRRQAPSRQAIRHVTVEFLNILSRVCRSREMRLEALFGGETSPYRAVEHISSYRETVDYVVRGYRSLYGELRGGDEQNLIVQSALRYIHAHYEEDLSLSLVAERVHCNASYLSRVFKTVEGVGFVQYLTDYRIDQAARLMEEGRMPIKTIAGRVGFANYNYFFKVFKRRMHTTPQLYMQNRPPKAP